MFRFYVFAAQTTMRSSEFADPTIDKADRMKYRTRKHSKSKFLTILAPQFGPHQSKLDPGKFSFFLRLVYVGSGRKGEMTERGVPYM